MGSICHLQRALVHMHLKYNTYNILKEKPSDADLKNVRSISGMQIITYHILYICYKFI